MKDRPLIVVQLVHILGPLKGEIQEFAQDVITIGRHPSCTVCFPADLVSVSRQHAEITRDGNFFRLTDHSSNGTTVNGKIVKEATLRDGDILEFSAGGPKVSFLTRVAEGEAEPPRPLRQEEPRPEPKVGAGGAGREPRPEAYLRERGGGREPQPEGYLRGGDAGGEPRPEPQTGNGGAGREPLAAVYQRPAAAQPPPEPAPGVSAQKVAVPLIIQFGPAIRSYREVPVTMGKGKRCDFVIDLPAIFELHAQIFFSQGRYWIKDLTGQQMVQLNHRPIQYQAPLNENDEISLTPAGPAFSFIGEGRLVEVGERIE